MSPGAIDAEGDEEDEDEDEDEDEEGASGEGPLPDRGMGLPPLDPIHAHLAAALVHDARTPLNTLAVRLGLLDSQISGGAGTDAARRTIVAARREIERMDELFDACLRTWTAPDGDEQPMAAGALLAAVAERAAAEARRRGVRIEIAEPAEVGEEAPIDGALALPLLSAIVLNAIDACRPGGLVRLVARHEGEEHVIEVHDDGEGFAPGTDAGLFRFGRTTRRRRAGVGLALAKQLAQALGGSLTLASAGVDLGALATLRIPRDRDPDRPL